MRYIANIITKSKAYKFNDFINICRNYSEIDKSIPTLVVGIDNVNKLIEDKGSNGVEVDYVFRQIDENIFWTFSTMEKRSDNESDVENFKKFIVKSLKNNIKYTFLNILTFSMDRMKVFLNFLQNEINKSYFVTDRMLYIAFDNTVWGISFDDCEYIGIKKEKIIKKIQRISINITSDKRFLSDDERKFFHNDDILLAAMFSYARS